MNAKSFFVPALAVSALAAFLFTPLPSKGEAAPPDDAALTVLLAEVAGQQTALADNQAKIDAKLAVVAEKVRVARLFVARGK